MLLILYSYFIPGILWSGLMSNVELAITSVYIHWRLIDEKLHIFVSKLSCCGLKPYSSHLIFKYCIYFICLGIYATVDFLFTLKCVLDIRTYSQMHQTDENSQDSSVIWPVRLNGWFFVYELSFCKFESLNCHLMFRHCTGFELRVRIQHSGTCRWQDNNMQTNDLHREVITTQLNHFTSMGKWLRVCLFVY